MAVSSSESVPEINASYKSLKELRLELDEIDKEYEKAEKIIVKLIQIEYKYLIGKRGKSLKQFYDKDNIIRIETKLLLSSDFSQQIKTPYLLFAKCPIVEKMVRQRHEQLQHVGINQLIVDIRSKFWIIGIRRLVKTVISGCVVCSRYRAKPAEAPSAPLPPERVTCSAPFQTIGVDLAGPLLIRNGEKCWVVLYTCAVYRAVHLELTRSLSTEAFIMTLRRFTARRGRASLIISDQGTNFCATKSLLSSLDWEEIQRYSSIRRIQWKMNAPTAAWWGGFWERLIRIMKDLLRRIIGKASLTYDELETLLCECEAVMNGRPLTYINNDNGDCFEPLTPAHFIYPTDQPITDVSDFNQIDTKSLNNRLRFVHNIREQFKERFIKEYILLLVQKGKYKNHNLKLGDIVLIETSEKRIKWPLGVVQKLMAGNDGIERTAEVRTSLGTKIRPVQRLYKLEISTENTKDLPTSDSPSCSHSLDAKHTGQLTQNSISETADEKQDIGTKPLSSRSGRQVNIPTKFNIYKMY